MKNIQDHSLLAYLREENNARRNRKENNCEINMLQTHGN